MIGPDAYFDDLLMRVVEGTASDEEFATFSGIIQLDRELRISYAREMKVHALLCCKSKKHGAALRGMGRCARAGRFGIRADAHERDATGYEPMRTSGGRFGIRADAHELVCHSTSSWPPEYRLNDQSAPCPVCSPLDGGGDQSAPWLTPAPLDGTGDAAVNSGRRTGGRRMSVRFRKVAALAAAMGLVATGLWLADGGGRSAAAVAPVAGRRAPVEILHRWGSCNLEVPERLPGTLRMTNGRITARLSSGIELVLLGPFELEIRTPMEAKLLSGRLLAEVPKSSGGFMLRTPDFEMWDNGALFGVTVTEDGSDVFVFEGEVQVVEADGEPVDICRDGEGARVRRDGSSAVKVAADWPDCERLLARVQAKGALNDPEDALWVASRISEGWAEQWMPKVLRKIVHRPDTARRMQTINGNEHAFVFKPENTREASDMVSPLTQENDMHNTAYRRKASLAAALLMGAIVFC